MPSPRTCSHVKPNGSKCGSPALKYHTHCYFHYEWQKRRLKKHYSDMREGWTTVTLPPLESKSAIVSAICDIQSSLLEGHINIPMARVLLYGVQLAIQVKASEQDFSLSTQDTCPDLEEDLWRERRNHLRPPQAVCDNCERSADCVSSTDCHHSREQIREFERIHEPERYARDRAIEEEGQRRYAAALAENARQSPVQPQLPQPSTQATALELCHGERSEPSLSIPQPLTASPALPLEGSPAGNCGDSAEQQSPSRASARRQMPDRKLFHSPDHYARLEQRELNRINILVSNS